MKMHFFTMHNFMIGLRVNPNINHIVLKFTSYIRRKKDEGEGAAAVDSPGPGYEPLCNFNFLTPVISIILCIMVPCMYHGPITVHCSLIS